MTPKMPLHAQSLNQFTTERKEGGKETKTGKKNKLNLDSNINILSCGGFGKRCLL